jgi:dinuclear metal center YbgI/SA1388 family protein
MLTRDLISYLDGYLEPARYSDSSNNGLQVQGSPEVSRVAFAVDACLASFEAAVAREAQLLIVHHGLFWSQHQQITGPHYARVRTLIANSLGLYASHLPLDAHAEVGNNIELARMAGLVNIEPWGLAKATPIGFIGDLPAPLPLAGLYARLRDQIGEGNLVQAGESQGEPMARRVAVCSGFGVTLIDEALAAGADTLITGETSHSWYHGVRERGINVIYGGHYNTETVGLKALERHIAAKFGLETVFIDLPTEL